ncbi:TetR/AcrR family transcriptional regulator [Desulfovermiculus halophilus]|jgi:AcrR family transcriptional regulator|uniref:TetR/AcrR family transcriptional regulator n=1 Tax=Desulfovermiculus halophilus TaxID=339722 RepID=UPI000A004877|nr:TetR/AcrR family transcriptional regulator [Desulfovermiculus halophilus]
MARRQKEKAQQTKEELMQSAARIFERKGFGAATIAEITDHAGYAKGSFYRCWKSKDEIFLDIMEARLREYRTLRQQKMDRAQNLDQMLNVLVDFLETIIDDENWSRVFLEFTIHAFGNKEVREKLNRSSYRLSTDLFSQILAPFIHDSAEAQKLGAFVIALFEGFLIQQFLESNVLSKQDLRQAILFLGHKFTTPFRAVQTDQNQNPCS